VPLRWKLIDAIAQTVRFRTSQPLSFFVCRYKSTCFNALGASREAPAFRSLPVQDTRYTAILRLNDHQLVLCDDKSEVAQFRYLIEEQRGEFIELDTW